MSNTDTHSLQISINMFTLVNFEMDFISKRQGHIPLKAVPYIFFIAVVLSITSTTSTFV